MHARDSRGRQHPEPEHAYRSPYQRDRDRILHSAAFRRLSGKMQVFTGDMGVYHRTRMTHTQEVASIARTIARILRLNEDLVEALALLHDIGHPPFGHCGEDALAACLKDDGGFSHNAFALDLATQLEQRYTNHPGLNLTAEVLDSQTHRTNKSQIQTPLLEAQVVDLADSMTYDAHDLDDSLHMGLIRWEQLCKLELVQRVQTNAPNCDLADRSRMSIASISELKNGNVNIAGPNTIESQNVETHRVEQIQRKRLVYQLIELQVDAFLKKSVEVLNEVRDLDTQAVRQVGLRLELPSEIEAGKQELESFLFEHVYRHEKLIAVRHRAATRVTQLFRLLTAFPDRLPKRFQQRARVVGVPRAIADYLGGMTDQFCNDQYIHLVELGREDAQDWE